MNDVANAAQSWKVTLPCTRAEAEASLATRFATIDANSNGFVTQDEMKAHHEAKRAEMKAKWEAKKAEAEAAGEPVREGKPKREKDPAKAAAKFPHGIGQIARPSDRAGPSSPRAASRRWPTWRWPGWAWHCW